MRKLTWTVAITSPTACRTRVDWLPQCAGWLRQLDGGGYPPAVNLRPSGRGRQLADCTQHDLDQWFGTGPTTRRHVITFLSWARQQRIIRNVDVPVLSADGTEASPQGSDARLAAIRALLLDQTLATGDRVAGSLVVLYGQQASKIAALRATEVSCADGATRLKLGADWLDVPEPVATLLRQHLRNRPLNPYL